MERDPGPPTSEEDAEHQLAQRVATQREPGPQYGWQEQECRPTPRAEDVGQADRGAGDAGRVEGGVANWCDQHEAKRGQSVGQKRGPELLRSAEKSDDNERRRMERRYYTQGANPLGSPDGPRVTDLPRAGKVHEVEE